MIKLRLLLSAFAIVAVIVVAGCGGGGSSSSGSSDFGSGPSPASVASPGSVVYVEGDLSPSASLAANANSVANTLAGIKDLGAYIVSKLESSASSGGQQVSFASEIEPWLGETAGVAFKRLEKDGELSEPLIAFQTTDVEATQAFIDKQAKQGKPGYKGGTYKGSTFEVGGSDGNAIGVIDEFLVIADGESEFKAAVDAADGDSLAGEDRFQTAISAASNDSLANVYLDAGALLEQSGSKSQAKEVLTGLGLDPSEATAVASVIPGSNQIEVDLSSDLGGEEAPGGDVSKLLGTLPASSLAAFAASGFGEQLEDAVDNLDKTGIPPGLPPNELKSTLSQAGIDLNKIAASVEDAAVFVEGSNRDDLGGALVVTSKGSEAAEAIASLGTLLRSAKVPGVTAISDQASGFSIRSSELGNTPVVVLAKGNRIAIGYGLAEALAGLNGGSGAPLSGNPTYKAAVSSLGDTPISAYAAGPAALRLAEALVPRSNTDFWEAQPYLKKIAYLALGSGTDGELATAKLIAGLEK